MKVLGVLLAVLLIVAVVIGTFMFWGFVWMVALGALSHIFDAKSLAIGYWSSVVVSFIVSLLMGGFVGAARGRN